MKNRALSAWLCVSLLGTSLPAVAGPSEETTARLEVDTSDLGGVGPVLKERLLERGAQVFRDEDIGAGGAEDPIVRVSVRESEGEDPGFDYEIRLITHAGEDGTAWSESCTLCTESELIESVAAELDKVAGSIRALETGDTEPAQDVPPPRVEPVTEDSTLSDGPSSHRLDTKGKLGIGLLALGVVAVGTGTGLALAPAQPLPDDPLSERYTQPPGFAVLAVGGALVVTGAVLLGLGLRDKKRSTARHDQRGFAALRW